MSQPSRSVVPRGFAGAAAGLGRRLGAGRRIRNRGLRGDRKGWGVKRQAALVQKLRKGRQGDKARTAEFDGVHAASVAEFETVIARIDAVGEALRAPT